MRRELKTDITCVTCGEGKRIQIVDDEVDEKTGKVIRANVVLAEKCDTCDFSHPDISKPLEAFRKKSA